MRQKWAKVAVTPQEKPPVAREPQEMWAVAQPPEAKVSGAANPLPWVAEPPQLLGGRLGTVASGCTCTACAPKPSSWPCMLMAQQPPSLPPRWLHLFLGGLPPPPILPPGASEPALHPSQPGVRYSTYSVSTLPQALKLTTGLATWPLGPPIPNASHCQHSCRCGTSACSGTESPVGGTSPYIHLCVCLLNIFLHWPLHGLPLLLHLRHILAWS